MGSISGWSITGGTLPTANGGRNAAIGLGDEVRGGREAAQKIRNPAELQIEIRSGGAQYSEYGREALETVWQDQAGSECFDIFFCDGAGYAGKI